MKTLRVRNSLAGIKHDDKTKLDNVYKYIPMNCEEVKNFIINIRSTYLRCVSQLYIMISL